MSTHPIRPIGTAAAIIAMAVLALTAKPATAGTTFCNGHGGAVDESKRLAEFHDTHCGDDVKAAARVCKKWLKHCKQSVALVHKCRLTEIKTNLGLEKELCKLGPDPRLCRTGVKAGLKGRIQTEKEHKGEGLVLCKDWVLDCEAMCAR